MSDQPERIWASSDWRRIDQGKWWDINPGGDAEEYIRAARIEALTEQRDAAREDAVEAEAYAGELEKELNTCRMAQAVMDNTVADLEAKLTKAVEALEAFAEFDALPTAVKRPDLFEIKVRKPILRTLAELKGESQDGMV